MCYLWVDGGQGEKAYHGGKPERARWGETETVVARGVMSRIQATRAEERSSS
jgi:hypothetical protein